MLCKGWEQLCCIPSKSGTCRGECWAQLREGFSRRKKILYKRVPDGEAVMDWIMLGKWVWKLEAQNFSFRDLTADCNTSKQQQGKALGKVNSLCGVRASTALTFPKSAPMTQVRSMKAGLDSLGISPAGDC